MSNMHQQRPILPQPQQTFPRTLSSTRPVVHFPMRHEQQRTMLVEKSPNPVVSTPTCCCGCLDVRIGSILIGVAQIVALTMTIIGCIIALVYDRENLKHELLDRTREPFYFIMIVIAFIWLLASVVLIYGAITRKSKILVPYLVVQGIGLTFLLVRGSFMIMACVVNAVNMSLGIFLSIFILVGIIVEAYFLWVCYDCYRYFEELKLLPPSAKVSKPHLVYL